MTCAVADMRFTVALYTDSGVSSTGEPDEDTIYCNLMDNIREWQPDNNPYFCVGCDGEFKNWDAVKEHFEAKQ